MVTPFALLLDRCGLSLREAADFLDVRIDTVKSWSSGRNPTPTGVITELRALYARIERAAAEDIDQIRQQAPAPGAKNIGISSDDAEAQSLGWPCVGAHAAVIGLIAARLLIPIVIVPRGATATTAKAADAHGA